MQQGTTMNGALQHSSHSCSGAWLFGTLRPGARYTLRKSPGSRFGPEMRRTVVHGFGDELLDYITAGPKLRKWYGEGERMPRDGGAEDLNSSSSNGNGEEEEVADAVLVLNAEGTTAEQVVLQLILARAKVRVLVRNAAAASTAYGAYVTPCQGDTGSARALDLALRGARAVVCTGRLGELPDLAARRGVQHLVVLCSCPGAAAANPLSAVLDAEAAAQRDPRREAAIRACSVPHTLVRVGRVRDSPGGAQQLRFHQQEEPMDLQDVSREDLARVLAECALRRPTRGSQAFAVEGGPPGEAADVGAALEGLLLHAR